jgi:hypothetical protein
MKHGQQAHTKTHTNTQTQQTGHKMAREKYKPESLYAELANPHHWVHWVDENGEQHHTPRSLASLIPPTGKILKDQT